MKTEDKVVNMFKLMIVLTSTLELLAGEMDFQCWKWFREDGGKTIYHEKKKSFGRLTESVDAVKKYLGEVSDTAREKFTDNDLESCNAILANKNAILRTDMLWCNAISDEFDQMALERFLCDLARNKEPLFDE